MRLRENIKLEAFIQAVSDCQGEVLYRTEEGDCLNLKSALSRFIFLSMIEGYQNLRSGHVVYSEADVPLLQEFLEIETR